MKNYYFSEVKQCEFLFADGNADITTNSYCFEWVIVFNINVLSVSESATIDTNQTTTNST